MDDNVIKQCYERLIDNESKEIYTNRLLYNLTDDKKYIQNIVFRKSVFRDLRDRLDLFRTKGKRMVLFGAGDWIHAGDAIRDLYGADIECFADNDLSKKEWYGKPVISYKQLKESYKDDAVIISSWGGKDAIYAQLLSDGFKEENIINLPYITDYYVEKQYFDLPWLTHCNDEVFVDCGAADGKTSLLFSNWCNGIYDYVYAFEPNKQFMDPLKKIFQSLRGEIIEKGTWSSEGTLGFDENGQGSKLIKNSDSEESLQVEVTTIDKALDGKKATFIKLDVEGAEAETIMGAENTIKRYKPKMAVCIYHKKEDPWVLPSLLLKYNQDYRFCVRHYFYDDRETVLYAI